jgi:hypothetical protein
VHIPTDEPPPRPPTSALVASPSPLAPRPSPLKNKILNYSASLIARIPHKPQPSRHRCGASGSVLQHTYIGASGIIEDEYLKGARVVSRHGRRCSSLHRFEMHRVSRNISRTDRSRRWRREHGNISRCRPSQKLQINRLELSNQPEGTETGFAERVDDHT